MKDSVPRIQTNKHARAEHTRTRAQASSLLKGLVPGLKSSPPSARNDSHTTGSPPATRRNSPAVNVR